jgi:hypothetical protein
MNERIKELSKQAAEFVEENSVNWVPEEFEQKFAELIVRECDRYARSAWEHGPLLGRDLLIHFGVVEMKDEQ